MCLEYIYTRVLSGCVGRFAAASRSSIVVNEFVDYN